MQILAVQGFICHVLHVLFERCLEKDFGLIEHGNQLCNNIRRSKVEELDLLRPLLCSGQVDLSHLIQFLHSPNNLLVKIPTLY